MTRVLALVAVVLLIVYLVSLGLERLRGKVAEMLDVGSPDGRARAGGGGGRASRGGELVACASCGVHVPRSRAVARTYCSETCRRRPATRS